jgi:hypothetical protein
MSELKSTGALPLPADEANQGCFPLGVDANLITFPFMPNAPYSRHIKDERNEVRVGSFALDGRSDDKEMGPQLGEKNIRRTAS